MEEEREGGFSRVPKVQPQLEPSWDNPAMGLLRSNWRGRRRSGRCTSRPRPRQRRLKYETGDYRDDNSDDNAVGGDDDADGDDVLTIIYADNDDDDDNDDKKNIVHDNDADD